MAVPLHPKQEKSRKPIAWLFGTIQSPPFSARGRIDAGRLLARLQDGELLRMPHSRPMPEIGPRVHELRVRDANTNWRIIYRLDADAVLVVDVFAKKSEQTPIRVIKNCKSRLATYDERVGKDDEERPNGTKEA